MTRIKNNRRWNLLYGGVAVKIAVVESLGRASGKSLGRKG